MLPAERGMLDYSTERPPKREFPERALQLGWFDWLTRHRRKLFAIVVAFYVLPFNGLWRVGVDSALYRGLARSIVRGDGYVFAGEHHRHAYPGLPWMLAGFERIFGESPVPGLIAITLCALVTLWLIDRTIALRFPLWVATVVTIGVGLNFRFVRESQELMTDVPFTFGVMLSLYGLERLRLLPTGAKWTAFARWATAMIGGLIVAAAMRPTFGVLALAIVIASGIRMIRGTDGRRTLHSAILAAALLVLLALFIFDPRTRGIAPWQGIYEQELLDRVGELPQNILQSARSLLANDLNDLFFCQRLWPLNYVGSLAILFGAVLMLRRNVAWGLMIFLLVAVTLPLSTVPRYFLMVAPFLWLGWALLCCHLTVRIPADKQGPVLALLLGFPLIVNVARSIDFIREQQGPTIAWLIHGGGTREEVFYKSFRDGTVIKQQHMAALIRDHTTAKQTTIGPEAHVLAYYADRRVIGERTLFVDRDAARSQWPKLVADAKPDFAIFPYGAYGENDALMRDLIRRRILVAELTVAKVDDVFLASASVRPPPAGVNWKNYKAPPDSTARAGSTGPTTRRSSTIRKGSATQRSDLIAEREHRANRAAKLQRQEKHAKVERQAAQQRRDKQAKIDRRERAEKQAKIDRRERQQRIERLKKLQKKHKQKRAGPTTR